MREGFEKQLDDLFLRERVLNCNLNHKLAHGFDVCLLEECLCVALNLLKVLSLQGNETFLE